ncbi:anaerobic ribonucleoside-triphosphate reductase, partial [Staphylococcus aureus]|uniref:anaerobic ribonucleoside-triphosphate reductase n=1 Tax=Staphylococcus aureus TaxID=1280 RepID=UPI0028CB2C06
NYKLKQTHHVAHLFKNKPPTISIPYIRFYQTPTLFYPPHSQTSQQPKPFTLQILKQIKPYQTKSTQLYHISFTIYTTPTQSLTHPFSRLDQ